MFLRQFSVERRKRPDGDEVPCPICSPNDPKYLHDAYLVWYRDEGVIRAIGPECGDSVFGGTMYAEAKGKFDLEERERRAIDFLEKNLSKTASMLAALGRLKLAVFEAERLYLEFTGRAPRIHERLRRLRGLAGPLEATVLGDASVLNARLRLVKDWQALHDILFALPRVLDADAAFLWVCEATPRLEQMEKAGAVLRRCSTHYVRLVGLLDRFPQFFSAPLFARLDAWGRREGGDFDLSASTEGGTFGLQHRSSVLRYGRTCRVIEVLSMRPDMAALSARGDWPGFE